jgi:hypothetical protein
VLALEAHHGARLLREAADGDGVRQGRRQQKLERDTAFELGVHRRHHDAHAAGAQHALDAVLARQDLARLYGREVVGGHQILQVLRLRARVQWSSGWTTESAKSCSAKVPSFARDQRRPRSGDAGTYIDLRQRMPARRQASAS